MIIPVSTLIKVTLCCMRSFRRTGLRKANPVSAKSGSPNSHKNVGIAAFRLYISTEICIFISLLYIREFPAEPNATPIANLVWNPWIPIFYRNDNLSAQTYNFVKFMWGFSLEQGLWFSGFLNWRTNKQLYSAILVIGRTIATVPYDFWKEHFYL